MWAQNILDLAAVAMGQRHRSDGAIVRRASGSGLTSPVKRIGDGLLHRACYR